jgi:CBS-domain-containing membrane protein
MQRLPPVRRAFGLAIVAMHLTQTFHPPTGINPLLIVVNALPWSFLVAEPLLGSLFLRSPGAP